MSQSTKAEQIAWKRSVGTFSLLAGVGWTLVIGVAAYWHFLSLRGNVEDLAKWQSRAFFEQIVVTRSWNALHGGVYVPVTKETQPNPYLKDPKRDVQTTDGAQLTKIDPAYMTRQIAELSARRMGVNFHITSRNPIRPANRADTWETHALNTFEKGNSEVFSRLDVGNDKYVYRYMAPLWTEQACLSCHAKQGYHLGDLRGGISIMLPSTPFSALISKGALRIWTGYGTMWLLGMVGLLISYRVLRKREADLEKSLSEIRTLHGLLPICSSCKKIRNDKNSWQQMESYVTEHSDAEFSHGICPDCMKKLYPKYADRVSPRKKPSEDD